MWLACRFRVGHAADMTNEVFAWTQATPWGVLAITADRQGVRSVTLGSSEPRKPLDATAPKAVRTIRDAFERFVKGDPHALDQVSVDLSVVQNDFQRKILSTLHEVVGPGQTISYGELASISGYPGAARAVGTAMARNPVPVVVPCHRVLAANGGIGGYGGGLEMKRGLLELEGVEVGTAARAPTRGARVGRAPARAASRR